MKPSLQKQPGTHCAVHASIIGRLQVKGHAVPQLWYTAFGPQGGT